MLSPLRQLRFVVPIVLFSTTALLGASAAAVGFVAGRARAVEVETKRLSALLSALEPALVHAHGLASDDLVRAMLDDLARDPTLSLVAIVDERGVLVDAVRAPSGITRLPAPEIDRVRAAGARDVLPLDDEVRFRGVVPLTRDGPGAEKDAYLVIDLDATGRIAQITGTAFRIGASFMVALLIIAATSTLWFRRRITDRAARIVDAVARQEAGDRDVRTGVEGADEIAEVAYAVDALFAALATQGSSLAERTSTLRTLFDNAVDGFFIAAPDGRYLDANPAGLALVGYTLDELRGLTMADLSPPDERVTLAPRMDGLRKDKSRLVVRHLLAKDGRSIPVEIRAEILPDGRVVGLVRDISARLDADRLRDQLVHADRLSALGTLAAGIGHEINNPLTFVLGNLHLALEQLPDGDSAAPVRTLIGEALEGAERIRTIVGDLRVLSRDRGETDDTGASVDVESVIDRALRIAEPTLRTRATVRRELEGVPEVRGDAQRLGQVLLNLLVNAADAMPDRPVSENVITLAVRRLDDGRVALSVSDNGGGIPPEVLPRIFDPFFTTKPVGEGTGLGLAISRKLVTAFGGELVVESTLGHGTTAMVRLPVAEPSAVRRRVAVESDSARRLLIVDDEPQVLRLLARLLAPAAVTAVATVDEARRALTSGSFDAILCDIRMPDGGAPSLVAHLERERASALPRLILMTGGAADTPEVRALTERFPLLSKPLDTELLHATIDRVIDDDADASLKAPA